MNPIILKPNFDVLIETECVNREHLREFIDHDFVSFHLHPYFPADSEEFIRSIRNLIAQYNIEDADTLIYLILFLEAATDEIIDHHYQSVEGKKRAKELAKLLIFLKDQQLDQTHLQIKGAKSSVTLKDGKLVKWLLKLLDENISAGTYLHDHGIDSYLLLSGYKEPFASKLPFIATKVPFNYDYIRKVAIKPVRAISVLRNREIKRYFRSLHTILTDYTSLKPEEGNAYSNDQMRFLFEVGCLLGYLDRDNMNSPEVDYMYSLVISR